jgi:hypothetical protein
MRGGLIVFSSCHGLTQNKVQEEMYYLVDTLVIHGVDQKWYCAFALIEGAEEMVTTQEIRAVS